MPWLELRDVGKIYRTASEQVAALEHISLALDQGDFVALTGKSGCGKSTLLHLSGQWIFLPREKCCSAAKGQRLSTIAS